MLNKRAPWYLILPALVAGFVMLVPLYYLLIRAFSIDFASIQALIIRPRTLYLLINTFKLSLGVAAVTTLLALPLSWLLTRTSLAKQRWLLLLCIVPLAIPGYVMAYAILGLSGQYGFFAQLFGVPLASISGYWGATLALSLYTFPYLFLNLRASLLGMDYSLDEAGRSLGYGPWVIFLRVQLPQLLPAFLAGQLVIILYVVGDFGAVALMRYEAFSYAIYTSTFDRTYAAWLSLMLIALTLNLLVLEYLILRKKRYAKVGSGMNRRIPQVALGRFKLPAILFIALVLLASIGLPSLITLFWLWQAPPNIAELLQLPLTFWRSAQAAVPAALLATLFAIPVAFLSVRYRSWYSQLLERLSYIGYTLPPLTLALAMVFFSIRTPFYQSLGVLILAWAMAGMALALGPIRSSLLQTRASLEEASYALGLNPWQTFFKVTFPNIKRSVLAGLALVLVLCMKELPMATLLAPTGYNTLAVRVFTYTVEGQLANAAPYAAAIIIFSSLFVGLILANEGKESA